MKLKSKSSITLTNGFYELLSQQYNILDIFRFVHFDHNFNILKEKLNSIKKHTFANNEKIIVEHFDTDYYNSKILKHGLNLYNFFSVAKDIDIPLSVFVICTNHYGIEQEINQLLDDHDINDRPLIIETFVQISSYNINPYKDIDINIDNIKYAGLSMMGAPRSHRFAFYNYLCNNKLLDKIKVSIRS